MFFYIYNRNIFEFITCTCRSFGYREKKLRVLSNQYNKSEIQDPAASCLLSSSVIKPCLEDSVDENKTVLMRKMDIE